MTTFMVDLQEEVDGRVAPDRNVPGSTEGYFGIEGGPSVVRETMSEHIRHHIVGSVGMMIA